MKKCETVGLGHEKLASSFSTRTAPAPHRCAPGGARCGARCSFHKIPVLGAHFIKFRCSVLISKNSGARCSFHKFPVLGTVLGVAVFKKKCPTAIFLTDKFFKPVLRAVPGALFSKARCPVRCSVLSNLKPGARCGAWCYQSRKSKHWSYPESNVLETD